MRKGFTMIELIFVIVILGILASVAIPRLASTRTDAEISAAIANLRTLQSDAAAYYVVKGEFGTATYGAVTNVALKTNTGASAANIAMVAADANAYLPVADNKTCIGVHFVEKNGNAPAHIKFTKGTATGACKTVQDTPAVQAFLNHQIDYVNGTTTTSIQNAIAIGSNTAVYPEATTNNGGTQTQGN